MKAIRLLLVSFFVLCVSTTNVVASEESDAAKIQRAMKAAPSSISANARILDAEWNELRPATNGNEWNVPIGLGVAKMVKFGNIPVKFQLAVEKSVVRQDDFGTDWNIRFNIIPVIPGLFQKPLF